MAVHEEMLESSEGPLNRMIMSSARNIPAVVTPSNIVVRRSFERINQGSPASSTTQQVSSDDSTAQTTGVHNFFADESMPQPPSTTASAVESRSSVRKSSNTNNEQKMQFMMTPAATISTPETVVETPLSEEDSSVSCADDRRHPVSSFLATNTPTNPPKQISSAITSNIVDITSKSGTTNSTSTMTTPPIVLTSTAFTPNSSETYSSSVVAPSPSDQEHHQERRTLFHYGNNTFDNNHHSGDIVDGMYLAENGSCGTSSLFRPVANFASSREDRLRLTKSLEFSESNSKPSNERNNNTVVLIKSSESDTEYFRQNIISNSNTALNDSSNNDAMSQSTRSQRLRSRRLQQQQDDDINKNLSSSFRMDRRRSSRSSRRSSANSSNNNSNTTTGGIGSFRLSVISIDDEVSVSSSDVDSNMEVMSYSYSSSVGRNIDIHTKKNRRSRQRKETLSGRSSNLHADSMNYDGNNHHHNAQSSLNGTGKVPSLLHRLVRTKALIWLLCFVGMTSVSMIIMTNHNITKSLDFDRKEHVSVMFRKNNNGKKSSKILSLTNPSVRRNEARQNEARQTGVVSASPIARKDENDVPVTLPIHGSINLNKLSHFQDVIPANKIQVHDKHLGEEHHSSGKLSGKVKSTGKKLDDHHLVKHSDKKKSAHENNHKHIYHHHDQVKVQDSHHHLSIKDDNDDDIVPLNELTNEMSTFVSVAIPKKSMTISAVAFALVDHSLYADKVLINITNVSSFKRIVTLSTFGNYTPPHREMQLYPSPYSDNTQVYPLLDSRDDADERIRTMEIRAPYTQGECVPMADWQTTFNPSCNGMHELDLADGNENEESFTLFGKNGFWRNAWKYDDVVAGLHKDTMVLKTLRINHRFEDAHYEHNRIDAVVLERLTASRHVIDIFGFCGHSVLTEYADGKRLGDLADKKKSIPLARLKIAIDIASGLADVHGIDGDEHASFVHLDINPANVVSIGGTLKLNDFNIGILRRWNTTSNKPCGIPTQYPNPQWRSPEEARGEKTLTEKVDVFSMGHIFFRLICGHEPWNKLEPGGMPPKAELNEKVKNGILPTIPKQVLQSKDPEVVAIREAMLQCYRYDPEQRPSARSIATKLKTSLDFLSKRREEDDDEEGDDSER